MSLDSLVILEEQKKDMIELNPTSETFTIAGGPSTFIGIFDDAYDLGPKDGGHVTQRATCPAIMVANLPAGLVKGINIAREDGTMYIWRRNATDEEGIPVILLYKDT